MLRLLTFVVCDAVVIDKQESPSIIHIWQKVTVEPFGESPGTALAADALSPQFWNVLAIWDHDIEDVGKEYKQKIQVIMPDGSTNVTVKADLPFIVKDDFAVNYIRIIGFPVGQIGTLKVKTWVESPNGDTIHGPVFYPIKVEANPASVKATT